jgi:VWFA-related protein
VTSEVFDGQRERLRRRTAAVVLEMLKYPDVQAGKFAQTIKLILTLGLACGISAQDKGQPPSEKPQTINVIARDQQDQPVGDLSIADLQVFDQGKPQKIIFLRSDGTTEKSASPPDPHQLSNRTSSSVLHLTVILFDLLNLNESNRSDAVDKMVRSLQSLRSENNLYLYFLTPRGGLDPVHGLAPTEAATPSAGSAWTQQFRPRLNQALRLASAAPTDTARAKMTYRALEILAQQAGSIPGRKDIIWIIQGVELSTSHAPFTNFRPRLKQLSTLLVQTNIAINPVYELAKGFGGLDAL